jgi:2-methylcitrate dehydratase PrpD
MDDLTPKIINHIRNVPFEAFDAASIDRAKIALLDIIAVAAAGFGNEITSKVRSCIGGFGGRDDSRIFFFPERLPSANAALVNATMSRVLDFDDTYELAPNGAHASAYIIPVALALADSDSSLSGKDVLSAIILASDVYCRMTRSIRANAVDTGRDNGPSVFGTTAAAMRLMRLTEDQSYNAFGIAYAHCAGEFQMYEEAKETVSIQQGLRARSGIEACIMASAGLTGPHEALNGRYGFFKAFEPVYEYDLIVGDLGKDFVARELSYKPYPCCKCTHPAISATIALHNKHVDNASMVRSVTIGTNRICRDFLAKPEETKWNPQTPVVAKFSLPFCVAVAAIKGRVGIADFENANLQDPAVRQLLRNTKVEIDDQIETTHGEYQNAPARVRITLANGDSFVERVDHPLGHPRNLPAFSDVVEKFFQCAEYSRLDFSQRRLDSLVGAVAEFDRLPSAQGLVDLICDR